MTIQALAEKTGYIFLGNGQLQVTTVAALEDAGPDDLIFIDHKKYLNLVKTCGARCALLADGIETDDFEAVIIAQDVKDALISILEVLYPEEKMDAEISSSASVQEGASIGKNVHIGAHAFIDASAAIDDDSVIHANAVVGPNCSIGKKCVIHPGVVLRRNVTLGSRVHIHANSVIGEDGYGYHTTPKGIRKIPQIGSVIIDDDVEIGACVCIDRGALGATRIGRGTKIDNLVQIAHNDQIGMYCFIAGQTGLSGSVKLGDRVILAGQVGVADHAVIEDDVIATAKTGITQKGAPKGSIIMGTIGRPAALFRRIWSAENKLPEMIKDIQMIKKKLENS